mgnify:CR=1 FL=1
MLAFAWRFAALKVECKLLVEISCLCESLFIKYKGIVIPNNLKSALWHTFGILFSIPQGSLSIHLSLQHCVPPGPIVNTKRNSKQLKVNLRKVWNTKTKSKTINFEEKRPFFAQSKENWVSPDSSSIKDHLWDWTAFTDFNLKESINC